MNPPTQLSSSPDLLVERRGSALWLTITRESRRNAMTPEALVGMAQAIGSAQTQPDVRAIVITGAGDKAFCSGADLNLPQTFVGVAQPHGHLAQLLRAAHASCLPLVARVNGACLAGGMGLLALCDMAVASPHAVFGLPEVRVGVFPAQVVSVLQHLIPRRVLTQMCLTGEPINAQQALQFNLINSVDENLDARLAELLAKVADKSPLAIRRGVYTLKHLQDLAFEDAVAFAESQIALLAMSNDAQEGQRAFAEKRPPTWSGT